LTKINGLCSPTCPHTLIAVLLMCRCISRPANTGKHHVFEIALVLRNAQRDRLTRPRRTLPISANTMNDVGVTKGQMPH
jgi:hypothetical protein